MTSRRLTFLSLVALACAASFALSGCLPRPLPQLDAEHIEGKLTSEVPSGWRIRGPYLGVRPEQLGVFLDEKYARSGRAVSLLSVDAVKHDWGTIMQDIDATPFRGQRVRFSGYIRANRVSGWAGLWMSVETESLEDIAYDDMEGRAIRGTSEWQRYDVVLDIDPNAIIISIGVALHGKGQIWFDDGAFTVVDKSVAVTDQFPIGHARTRKIPSRLYEEPVNLNFDEEFFE